MPERVDAFGAAPLTSKAEPGDDVGAVHAGTLAGSQRSVPAADRRGAAAAGNATDRHDLARRQTRCPWYDHIVAPDHSVPILISIQF